MAEEKHETCHYVPYTKDLPTDNAMPARYRPTPRGGKRRQTTIAKRQSHLSLDDPERRQSREEKYKISSDDSSISSVDENYDVDSITSSIEETLTLVHDYNYNKKIKNSAN